MSNYSCTIPGCARPSGRKQYNAVCSRHNHKKRTTGTYDGMEDWYAEKDTAKELVLAERAALGLRPHEFVDSLGYVRSGTRTYLHREVMAEMLGRELTTDESVHHKDGNRLNNCPSNLELWSKYQPAGQRAVDKLEWAREILRLYKQT